MIERLSANPERDSLFRLAGYTKSNTTNSSGSGTTSIHHGCQEFNGMEKVRFSITSCQLPARLRTPSLREKCDRGSRLAVPVMTSQGYLVFSSGPGAEAVKQFGPRTNFFPVQGPEKALIGQPVSMAVKAETLKVQAIFHG